MEDLFSTTIDTGGKSTGYRVIFENENYVFLSGEEGNEYSRFSFKRESDQWMDGDMLPPAIKQQALDALEKYLLTQH